MPPEGLAAALPLFPPLQLTLLESVALAVKAEGWVMLADAVAVHPFLSLTVTV
jgi:hypothetical protein